MRSKSTLGHAFTLVATQPVVERHLGRARVRHGGGAGFELHDRVGLLDAARDDAARTVVFPAPRDDMDAVGEQRGGERVAHVPLVALAVEREMEPRAAVDATSGGQAATLRHSMPPDVLRRRFTHLVHRRDLVRDGIAPHVEPSPAAVRMHPLLEVRAARVLAHEEVIAPLLVGQRVGVDRPHDVRFAAVGELGLLARAAPWAGDQQHGELRPDQ